MKKGFTLIELLVVVLIIGILSAVALPKYEVAVGKARYTQAMVLAKAIAEAQRIYYMGNGTYARDWDILDVSLPSGGTVGEYEGYYDGITYKTDQFICVTFSDYFYVKCRSKQGGSRKNPEYVIDDNGQWCMAYSATDQGEDLSNRICKSMGGVYDHGGANTSEGTSFYSTYRLP